MDKRCSQPFIAHGATILWLSSLYVFSPKRTSMHPICCIYCKNLSTADTRVLDSACNYSADLEITVSFLVQIDKLVQLIESPVFTCKYAEHVALLN
jgi:Vacuolar protein 14 C-terminal Fig4p binding